MMYNIMDSKKTRPSLIVIIISKICWSDIKINFSVARYKNEISQENIKMRERERERGERERERENNKYSRVVLLSFKLPLFLYNIYNIFVFTSQGLLIDIMLLYMASSIFQPFAMIPR